MIDVDLPRIRLAALPTPLERAERLEDALGLPPVYVKRDDLAGFGAAGNKARKLELLLGDALARGCDTVVTGGGQGSNHCATAAAAARSAGLACVIVYAGTAPAQPGERLTAARGAGAEVTFTHDSDRASVDHALPERARALEQAGSRPYVIPRGGASAVGAVACALAAGELASQIEALGLEPRTVLMATGSGGTQAGVMAGAALLGTRWRVVGASVSRPVHECRRRVAELATRAAQLLDGPAPASVMLDVRDARGPGFGQPAPQATTLARVVEATQGLRLDPVYTAKAMTLLGSVARQAQGAPVVFWHTGGTQPAPQPPVAHQVEMHG